MLIVLALLVAVLQAPTSPRAERRIAVGERLTGELLASDGAAGSAQTPRCYELVAGEAGRVTIDLESYDFDAHLRVERQDGALLAQDDDSGIELDARISLSLEAGAGLFVITSSRLGSGEFTLSIHPDKLPLPTGVALVDAEAAWLRTAAERALARGNQKEAMKLRVREGIRRSAAGRFEDAKVAFEVSLDLALEAGDRAGEAEAIGNLGLVYQNLGEFAHAREHHEQHLEIVRELGDRAAEARGLGNLGLVHGAIGEYPRAKEYHERRLAIALELGDRRGQATALGNLGNLCYHLGEYSRARECHQRALGLARDIGDREREAKALANLGKAHSALGEYPQARERLEEALSLSQASGDRVDELSAVIGLGLVESCVGHFSRAQEHCERGLALAREIGNKAWEATALGELGNVYFSIGDLSRGRMHFEESLATAREVGDRRAEAVALGNLGVLQRSLGNEALAREHLELQLELALELETRPARALALANLGNVCLSFGDYSRARELYEQSLALARDLHDRHGEARIHASLGAVESRLEDFDRARDHLNRCLVLARELGDRATEALALSNLASTCFHLGESIRARELAVAADSLAEQIGSREERICALQTLAWASLSLRDSSAALEALQAAEGVIDELVATGLETDLASGMRGRFAELGLAAQDLTALRTSEAGTDRTRRLDALTWGFAAAGRWKGRALLEGLAEHRSGARSAEAIELRRRQREARARRSAILELVTQAIHDGKSSAEVDDLRAQARTRLAEAEALAERLREVSPRDAALDLPIGADAEVVRMGTLGPRSLLVEYVDGRERFYAYVLGGSEPAFLDLGPREAIEVELERFLSGLRDPDRLSGPDEVARAGRSLFQRLLEPALSVEVDPIERLVIVPCAQLAALPFEALVVAMPADRPAGFAELTFVLDRHELTYAPSSPVLVELASIGPRREGGKVLLLADPRYASEPPEGIQPEAIAAVYLPRALPDPASFERLTGTRDEALAIARLLAPDGATELDALGSRRSGSFTHERVDLHLGEEASRERLSGDLRGYSVLHLACHGFVDAEVPRRTGIALSFSGADDGYFTILDALELDLDADLVVLSACDTARGEARAGEGIESLARGLMYAGARSVVASTWKVHDAAAARTMQAFYRGWLQQGLPPARALREAKLALRRGHIDLGPPRGAGVGSESGAAGPAPEFGHPYYWAPFLHIGLGG